jgi:hypothetical protein
MHIGQWHQGEPASDESDGWLKERTVMGQVEYPRDGSDTWCDDNRNAKDTNYYTKHKGKWITQYNPCLDGKLPLHVSTNYQFYVFSVWEPTDTLPQKSPAGMPPARPRASHMSITYLPTGHGGQIRCILALSSLQFCTICQSTSY